jgi:ankyrin repeat protein
MAIIDGKEEVIKCLIEHKCDLNSKDVKGNTALLRAIEKGSYSIVELLVKSGVDISGSNGKQALFKYLNKHSYFHLIILEQQQLER